MADRTGVTPDEIYDQVAMLISAGHDEAALDYWAEVGLPMRDELSFQSSPVSMDGCSV